MRSSRGEGVGSVGHKGDLLEERSRTSEGAWNSSRHSKACEASGEVVCHLELSVANIVRRLTERLCPDTGLKMPGKWILAEDREKPQ